MIAVAPLTSGQERPHLHNSQNHLESAYVTGGPSTNAQKVNDAGSSTKIMSLFFTVKLLFYPLYWTNYLI